MLKVIATLKSAAPYSQSRQYERECPKEVNETHDQYEYRTWRLKCHTDQDGLVTLSNNEMARAGNIVISGIVFQRALCDTAKFRQDKIAGRGRKTYIDVFKTGVIVFDSLVLPILGSDVIGEWLSVSPTGRSGERGVWKCFPKISEWRGDVSYTILDESVMTKTGRGVTIFEETLRTAGQFGIGRWRPLKSGGMYGRFGVSAIRVEKIDEEVLVTAGNGLEA